MIRLERRVEHYVSLQNPLSDLERNLQHPDSNISKHQHGIEFMFLNVLMEYFSYSQWSDLKNWISNSQIYAKH